MESKGMMLRDVHTYLALPIRGPKGINPTQRASKLPYDTHMEKVPILESILCTSSNFLFLLISFCSTVGNKRIPTTIDCF